MQNDLEADIYRSAALACAAFPAQLSRLVFFVTERDAPVFVAPEIAAELSSKTQEVKRMLERETNYINARNAAGMAYRAGPVAGVQSVKMIGLVNDVLGVYTAKNTKEMRTLYVVDHEIGHHVVARGLIGGHEGECRADAFAALRHIQRYGLKTDFFKFSSKASTIVLATSPIHYTEDTFKAVLRYARKNDISKLSLQQTAELAAHIVDSNPPQPRSIEKLSVMFRRAAMTYYLHYKTPQNVVRALYDGDAVGYDMFCRETAKAMNEFGGHPGVLKAGKRFLNYPPILAFIKEKALGCAEWQDILQLSQAPVTPQRKAPVATVRHRILEKGAL